MATVTAHGVNFIDENDARRGFLALLEHVADTRRADADEHFDEIRAANGEERDVCFARDRARQQRLARAGRANHQNAFWNTAAEFLKRSEEHTSELQSHHDLVCRLLLEKKNNSK